MHEDMRLGFEYRNTLEIIGLSYDDQLWVYGLGLYCFSKTQDYSNLMRDERVLHRMISMGLYDDEDSMNNLGARRAMMHRVVMMERLWKLIREEHAWVGAGALETVIALTFFALFLPSSHTQVPPLTLYDFTTLPLFLNSDNPLIPFPLFPLFTWVKNKTKWPTAFF